MRSVPATFVVVLVACLLVLPPARIAPGQCPPPAWSALSQWPGANAIVRAATVWDPDGAGPAVPLLVIGGYFSVVGGTAAASVAAWDGVSWRALGAGTSWRVHALTVWNGDLIAGGTFATAGGLEVANIARWNGSTWQALGGGVSGNPNPGVNQEGVFALAVFNGELVAGGRFTAAGDILASNIARWDGSTWRTLGPGVTSTPNSGGGVFALQVWNSTLYAGGEFTAAGATPVNNLSSWDGTSWSPVGGGVTSAAGGSPRVYALADYGGELVAGGSFDTAGTVPAAHLARWNGTVWQPIGTAAAVPGAGVWALATFGADLIIGGSGVTNGLARWNGTTMSAFAGGYSFGGVSALAGYGELVLGGAVYLNGTIVAPWLARFDGSVWLAFTPGFYSGATPCSIFALGVHGGALVAGGSFITLGGPTAMNIARWSGGAWLPLGAGVGIAPSFSSGVSALAEWNGDLFAGGLFTSAGGVLAANIARWDGVSWNALGGGIGGTFAGVSALAVYNGELVAGGIFTSAGGVPALNIAGWNGTVWQPLGPGLSGTVNALTVYNGELVAGGQFLAPGPGGASLWRIARWNGASWLPLGAGTDAPVRALAVDGPTLVAGGDFSTAGSVWSPRVARWNGSSWQALGSFTTNASPSDQVRALAAFEGSIVAGGYFMAAGGVTANYIARWDGISWQGMSSGADRWVNALVAHDGGLVASGCFATMGGVVSPGVARWARPFPRIAVAQPGGAGSGVVIANADLVAGREYYNIASLDLCPGGPGSGPIGGLCFNDLNPLLAQLQLPVGAAPFHWTAAATTMSFGPFLLPAGLVFEAVCLDATGGVLGCIAPAVRVTVN